MSEYGEHFIREIEIKNYKLFKDFKAKGFGRVNLIGGKNNVGKTAFMEALELFISTNDTLSFSYYLYLLIRRRQSSNRRDRYFELDFLYKNSQKMLIENSYKKIEVEYLEELPDIINDISEEANLYIKHEPSLKLTVNDNQKIFSVSRILDRPPIGMRRPLDFNKEIKINFISSATTDERDIAILYGKLIDLNKESFLNNSLRIFDDNIISLKQKATDRDIVLKLQLKNQELPVLLSSVGEGVNRYITILCGIWASQNGFLFIDEIENGIHYTNYDKLWKIIFLVSKEANVQVFATTHSKECIESFNRVQKELNDEDTFYFEMYKNIKNDNISMRQLDAKQLEYELNHQGRYRGE